MTLELGIKVDSKAEFRDSHVKALPPCSECGAKKSRHNNLNSIAVRMISLSPIKTQWPSISIRKFSNAIAGVSYRGTSATFSGSSATFPARSVDLSAASVGKGRMAVGIGFCGELPSNLAKLR